MGVFYLVIAAQINKLNHFSTVYVHKLFLECVPGLYAYVQFILNKIAQILSHLLASDVVFDNALEKSVTIIYRCGYR